MASLEEALYARISVDAAYAAIASTRLYPDTAPPNPVFPFSVMARTSTRRDHVMNPGVSAGVTWALIEFQHYADKTGGALQAKSMADATRASLDAFSGTISGIDVFVILAENEMSFYESEVEAYKVIQTFRVLFRE